MKKRYFGTDGIRGRVGKSPIEPEFMLRLGWAVGKVFGKNQHSKVLIGKDTRISGYMFEAALEAGLSAAGADILLLGPIPTPAVAYLTRTFHAQAGIVISASHNPYYDNGIKFFSETGTKLQDSVELEIEKQLQKTVSTVDSDQLGKAVRINDAYGRYIEFCKSTIAGTSLAGLKIVVDCAHGATYQIAPSVFDELGAEVVVLSVHPDGLNINQDSGSTNPEPLCKAVLEYAADVGIAFDGDGDRVIMVDHKGEVVDGDELLFIIAGDNQQRKPSETGVVGTVMSNIGLELALADKGVPFLRAKVGDRHVMELLSKHNWKLGGESSGHLICLDLTTTGDGIISSLQVLQAMVFAETCLHELKSGMRKYPQIMLNVPLEGQLDLENNQPIQDAVAEVELKLQKNGRVLLRKSGTEPLLRVMVEGRESSVVKELAQELADVVEKEAV